MKNNYKVNTLISLTKEQFRPGHAIGLKDTIENLNALKSAGKPLTSLSNELNNIVNSKDNKSILFLKFADKNIKNNIVLPNLFFPNSQIKTDLKLATANSIQNTAKYFNIGNKFMSLSVFKALINNFNADIKKIETYTQETNKNYLRHYLNILTKFDFNLFNNS